MSVGCRHMHFPFCMVYCHWGGGWIPNLYSVFIIGTDCSWVITHYLCLITLQANTWYATGCKMNVNKWVKDGLIPFLFLLTTPQSASHCRGCKPPQHNFQRLPEYPSCRYYSRVLNGKWKHYLAFEMLSVKDCKILLFYYLYPQYFSK